MNIEQYSKAKLIEELKRATALNLKLHYEIEGHKGIYKTLKEQYIAISKAADEEYQKFCTERDELREALKAKDLHIARVTEDFKHFSSMVRIIKATVNSVVIKGEDERDPCITG